MKILLVLLTLGLLAVAFSEATSVTLTVRAWVDGKSDLYIADDLIWWDQADYTNFARPGKFDHHNKATYLNDQMWHPEWSLATQSTNSFHISDLGWAKGVQGFELLDFKVTAGRGTAAITKSLLNAYTWTVHFDDEATVGADWYEVVLAFAIPDKTCASLLPLGCPFAYVAKTGVPFETTDCASENGCVQACCDVAPVPATPTPDCGPVLQGWAHTGGSFKYKGSVATPQACCDFCKATAGCLYWSHNGNAQVCYLHNFASLFNKNDMGWVCSYPVPNVPSDQCGPVLDGWKHGGSSLAYGFQPDPASCCAFCKATPGCKFWSYSPTKVCYAVAVPQLQIAAGYKCSYSSIVDDSCGPILAGWGHSTSNIGYMATPDVAACCAYCQSNPNCKYWTWDNSKTCWLHSTFHLVQNRQGFICSYPAPTVLPNQCAPVGKDCGYTAGTHIDYMGTPDAASCCSFCGSNPNCKYWTWTPEKTCYLHPGTPNVVRGYRSGGYTCGAYAPQLPHHTPHKCQGKWIEVGVCSMPCNTGKKMERFVVSEPAKHGGEPCEALDGHERFVDCNRKPCPDDCVGMWLPVGPSSCSKSCGWGTTTLEYNVVKPAVGKGHGCEHRDEKRITKPCFVQKCPAGVTSSSSSVSAPAAPLP